MAVSISSLYTAALASRHYATGYIRRLALRGVRFRHLLASQLLLSASIALVLGLLLGIALSVVGEGLSLPALLLSSILLSLVLTALYLVFSGSRQQPQAAVTRTLLGCLALLFFLLFAGGGFYPTELMQSSLRLFNPTWLAHQLAVWSLGGTLDVVQLLPFVATFALSAVAGFVLWRRAL